jgi:multiple sugar transport system permease protein/putative aldouronate transport system permease protein
MTSATVRRPRSRYRTRRSRHYTSVPMRILKTVVLVVACALVLIPFIMVISTSLADPKQVNDAGGFVLWPERPNFDAYVAILSGGTVSKAVFVSIGVTLVGTALSLTCTAMLAYALSRPGSFAHKPVLLAVLFTLLFSPGIIPTYLVVSQLGLINSYWSLILPVAINAFNVIIMRAFFMELPQDIIDSARLDGAGEVRIFLRIVLPLSTAVIAVVGLFYAVSYWNAFFTGLLYLNDTSMWPLQLILRTYVINGSPLGSDALGSEAAQLPQQTLQMAILVVSLVPILLVYPFIQRHFAKGMLTGAVKG